MGEMRCLFFLLGSRYIAQNELKLTVMLSQPPEYKGKLLSGQESSHRMKTLTGGKLNVRDKLFS